MTLRLAKSFCAFVMAVAVLWPELLAAQSQSRGSESAPAQGPRRPEDSGWILRTYEVGDLILNIQDRPYSDSLQPAPRSGGGGYGGGGFGGGGGIFSVPRDVEQGALLFDEQKFGAVARLATANAVTANLRLCQFGGGGGGGGGLGQGGMEARPVASITMDDLIRVLTSTVARDSWIENGGEAQVEPLGAALVIWQTAEVHRLIGGLFEDLRQGLAQRKTVTIDARWLLLTSNDLESLLPGDQEGVPLVNRERLEEFTRRPSSIRGITNCFSSQLVYLVSGTMRNVVSGYIPVVGSVGAPNDEEQLASGSRQGVIRLVADTTVAERRERSVGYQPIVEKPNFGALLEIRPTLVPLTDREPAAVVDLKSTITAGGQSVEAQGKADRPPVAPQVDRIEIETQQFATTLRLPLAKPVLVGGMTYVPSSIGRKGGEDQDSTGNEGKSSEESRQLYLVLEIR